MSWYRTGTVAVTNGSKTVTGVGTLWTTAVNAGDAFALVDANLNPTGAWYEVEAVVSNTEITLKQSYAGTTGSNKQYCVFNLVGNMTTPSFAQRLATFFASFQSLIDKPTTTPTALGIPVADENGNIDSGWIKDASETVKGVVELATTAETSAGQDATRAVTPAGVAAALAKGATELTTTDLNSEDYFRHGVWLTPNSDLTNLPSGYPSSVRYMMETLHHVSYSTQTIFALNASSYGKCATRVVLGGSGARVFGPWQIIYNSENILGTVSQVGGVPTGAVIEKGANANGYYTKFADGTLICYCFISTNRTATTATGALFRSSPLTWTFPVSFLGNPTVSLTGGRGADDGKTFFLSQITINGTAITFVLLTPVAIADQATQESYIAIGRWF
jgi:hypothetical protein